MTGMVTKAVADAQARSDVLSAIVAAELSAWVPGASQRLIRRAADSLGLTVRMSDPDIECPDGRHCITYDWVAGHFVTRCVRCDRLTRS